MLSFAAAALSNLNVNRDLAATLIDRAIALNPGTSLVWFASGVLQLQRGEPDVALSISKQRAGWTPSLSAWPRSRVHGCRAVPARAFRGSA